ncbi:Gag protein [Phytophthora palmivora]|uniref:Gag protein n=1 Tax=Phytophthora palmivora TaxID=4796 RepID=A0A2P4XMJ1_9STRA|nr:Gag protein [Phytophthora palmivora]
MVGIFGGDALRSWVAATQAEQVERMEAFNRFIAHVQGLQGPMAELKPAQSQPLRLKVNPYEGKEGENLHFWVREVELAMDAAHISSDFGSISPYPIWEVGRRLGRTRARQRRRVVSRPGISCANSLDPPSSDVTLSRFGQVDSVKFLMGFELQLQANYEYHQRSRFLACKKGKRELHKYIQVMRIFSSSLEGNPLPKHVKVTVFMGGLKVGPSRTQLFTYTRTQ